MSNVYVLADGHDAVSTFADVHKLYIGNVRHVSRAEHIRGLEGITLYVLHNAPRLKSYDLIMEEVKTRDIEVVHVAKKQ